VTARTVKHPPPATLAVNRSAGHEFHLLKRHEAGIVLTGAEVKSARAGRVNLREGYARVKGGEVFLLGVHFGPYQNAREEDQDPRRPRKLLLHASEIRKLDKETQAGGSTLVPTRLYLKQGRIKVEIAVARGKQQVDKREALKKRAQQREIDRARGGGG
jgi:SsrA-binding protein